MMEEEENQFTKSLTQSTSIKDYQSNKARLVKDPPKHRHLQANTITQKGSTQGEGIEKLLLKSFFLLHRSFNMPLENPKEASFFIVHESPFLKIKKYIE